MVTAVVSKVLGEVDSKISALQHDNASLNDRIAQLELRIDILEKQNDINNQYSKRNCLPVSDIKEEQGESMDSIFKCLSTEIKVGIDIHDIDNMHRLGKPKSSSEKSSTGHLHRTELGKSSSLIVQLKHSKILERVFINEELTKTRGEVYYHARRLVKNKRVQSAWTSNGVILIKDNSDKVHRCESMGELVKFN
ncbi:hypothetical protein MAR_006632 [Mya arenaria]|uniref:Uncharacterized protein n=1 Tax=Mya arenaria TaxID=6604 RepID=A0ABY7DC52_MYAAR|nr:hypothetical protein MAR_006632 [Mya arenaria]